MDVAIIEREIAGPGHNLKDELTSEIDAALAEFKSQYDDRGGEIDRCKVTNNDEAERATALAGILMDLHRTADTRRAELKAPHLAAGRKIDGSFGAFLQVIVMAKQSVVAKIDAYKNEQRRKAQEAADKAARELAEKEAAARKAAEAGNLVKAAQLEREADAAAAVVQEAVAPPQPIRSAYGQTASGRTEWHGEIIDRKKLPASVTNHPKVVDALNTVIASMVRSGVRDIPGVRIWGEEKTVIRR